MGEFLKDTKQSKSLVAFVATVVIMALMLIVSTVWAYGRLYTARTNIPTAHLTPAKPAKPVDR